MIRMKQRDWKPCQLGQEKCGLPGTSMAELPLIDFLIWAATWQNQQNECVPSKDSDQPGHPPSLIQVFAVRMKNPWVLSYPLSVQPRLWSDWASAQADLSLHWAHTHFDGFVMSWLIYFKLVGFFQSQWVCVIHIVNSFEMTMLSVLQLHPSQINNQMVLSTIGWVTRTVTFHAWLLQTLSQCSDGCERMVMRSPVPTRSSVSYEKSTETTKSNTRNKRKKNSQSQANWW